MIVTVTLNPSLDRTLGVRKFELGAVHRAEFIRQDLGGKGINVSRALRALSIPSQMVAILAGRTGRSLREGLNAEGYAVHSLEVSGETRQNITLLDESTGVYTKINEPGPMLDPEHIAAFKHRVEGMVQPGDLWAFCGSLPPGAPHGFYAELITLVQQRGGLAFLDTSGPAFRVGLTAGPFAIKPNSDEAAEALQFPLCDDHAHHLAARNLQREGVRLVALTRGAQGLVLAMDGALVVAAPPPVAARSPVGAGDASLAGLLWAVSDHCNVIETARRIVACGTAAAMQAGSGVGDRVLVESLMRQVQVVQV